MGTDYVPGKYGYRALDPRFIHRQIVRCRDERMAYLAVHNHGSDTSVRFSKVDMDSHKRGYPALRDIGKGVPVGALVFGRRAVAADIWMPDGSRRALGSYRIVGRTIRRLYANAQGAAKAGAGFDRQVRMFGNAGQAVLGASKVAVVGLGGVGSLVAEYIARLGVGHLVLVDLDVIEDTNLSRVVGATPTDVETGQLKTQIAVRHLREARPDTRLEAIQGDVANDAVAKKLRDCRFHFSGGGLHAGPARGERAGAPILYSHRADGRQDQTGRGRARLRRPCARSGSYGRERGASGATG